MASLQQEPSGTFHVTFRFDGKRFKRSLQTKSPSLALGRKQEIEQTLLLISSKRLPVPPDVCPVDFILSGGRITEIAEKVSASAPIPVRTDSGDVTDKPLTLKQLFAKFFESIPEDHLEPTTYRTMQLHRDHFLRVLKAGFPIRELTGHDLQRYVNTRAKETTQYFSGGVPVEGEKKRVRGQRSTRCVPISPQLESVLLEWFEKRPAGRYTFSCTGSELTFDQGSCYFSRTVARSKWRVLRGWHVLRHSFISNCASAGVDQRMIDDWVGHQTDAMRRRYRHLFPNRQRAALASVFN